MKPTPTIVRRTVTADEVRADVAAWKQAHPGLDETNFADGFRDDAGGLHETDEFFEAAQLFSVFKSLG